MNTPAVGFQKRLGLFDATMLVAGSMIGSGVFITSAGIAQDVRGAGWLLAAWAVAGLMTILGALAYAELAAMMPHAGGQYIYLREAYSPLWGFLYGWTSFTVIQTGTIAAVGVAFAKFLGVLVPSLGTGPEAVIYEGGKFAGIPLPLPWLAEPLALFELKNNFTITRGQLVGVASVCLLTWWNCRGVQGGKWLQNLFTVTKISALLLVIAVVWFMTSRAYVWENNFAEPWAPIRQSPGYAEVTSARPGWETLATLMVFGGALVGALFSCDAWNNVTFTAGEIRRPERDLPLALILGTGGVIGLYLLTNAGYLAGLPIRATDEVRAAVAAVKKDKNSATSEQLHLEQTAAVNERGIELASNDRVATALMEIAMPTWGVQLMAVVIMISTFGCNNGLILMGARLTYAMARDSLFFRSCGQLNRHGVPAVGLWLQALWASALTFSGTYNDLLDYVIFAALLFYALTVVGLFVLRWRQPTADRPYRAIGYPVLPALYVFLCLAVMVDLLIVKPKMTWPGLLLVLLGVPVYGLWKALGAVRRNGLSQMG